MPSLKLESFSHDVEIRKGISKFESFEALRDTAFNDGVKSGADAASRAFEAEKIRTLSPILEALNDLAFSQIEARHAALNSMRPMVEQLLKTLLPDAAKQGLGTEISAILAEAYKKSPQARIHISVAPDAVSPIQSMLSPAKADFTIEPDPSLTELQAKIGWQGGFDQIDLEATLSDMREAVDVFFTNVDKAEVQNG